MPQKGNQRRSVTWHGNNRAVKSDGRPAKWPRCPNAALYPCCPPTTTYPQCWGPLGSHESLSFSGSNNFLVKQTVLLNDSSQTAREEGQPKETNNQSKKAIYIPLAQAILLYDESADFRNMCQQDPVQFISVIE
ncbi:hypothetical protein V8E55_011739 [Tylopilus felleus]